MISIPALKYSISISELLSMVQPYADYHLLCNQPSNESPCLIFDPGISKVFVYVPNNVLKDSNQAMFSYLLSKNVKICHQSYQLAIFTTYNELHAIKYTANIYKMCPKGLAHVYLFWNLFLSSFISKISSIPILQTLSFQYMQPFGSCISYISYLRTIQQLFYSIYHSCLYSTNYFSFCIKFYGSPPKFIQFFKTSHQSLSKCNFKSFCVLKLINFHQKFRIFIERVPGNLLSNFMPGKVWLVYRSIKISVTFKKHLLSLHWRRIMLCSNMIFKGFFLFFCVISFSKSKYEFTKLINFISGTSALVRKTVLFIFEVISFLSLWKSKNLQF
jgi:hypothetical protein